MMQLQKIRSNVAGIDLGSSHVFVATEQWVRTYRTFTVDLNALRDDLLDLQIESVAMEATGVYWIWIYDLLIEAGMEVYLVNPSSVKMVPGRKSDVQDCQWLARLHAYGLLNPSVVLTGELRQIRQYIRMRENHIEQKSRCINRMQKALVTMNIRLKDVISQVHGVSGMRIIRAILQGERDPEALCALCHWRILQNKREEVIKSLQGIYNLASLFELQQAVEGMEFFQRQIAACDRQLEQHLEECLTHIPKPEQKPKASPKPIRWHRPQVNNLHEKLFHLTGCEASVLPGMTDYTSLKLVGELGTDMSKWPTEKQFVSWLGLAPGKNQSGKQNRRSRKRYTTRASQIFLVAAQSLLRSKYNALGEFGRRIRARRGAKVAVKALARKLALMYYRLHVHGMEYVELGAAKYRQSQLARKRRYIRNQALKLGMKVADM